MPHYNWTFSVSQSGSCALSRAVRLRMLCVQLTKEFTGNVSGNEMCVCNLWTFRIQWRAWLVAYRLKDSSFLGY